MDSPASSALISEAIRNKPGHDTDILGQWITQYLASTAGCDGYRVYYDHGDSDLDNVAAVKGFFGETVANENRLADIDIMIVTPDNRVAMLIEVEERGSSPKKILGDVLAILMCNRFAVRKHGSQHYFALDGNTRLLVAGILPDSGKRITKIENVLQPRLGQLGGFLDGINPSNVDLIFHSTILATVTALQGSVSARLPA